MIEHKFKEGDRVKCVKTNAAGYTVGERYTVHRLSRVSQCVDTSERLGYYIHQDRLELVRYDRKFKPGDKVQCTVSDIHNHYAVGGIYTVKVYRKHHLSFVYTNEIPNHSIWDVKLKRVEEERPVDSYTISFWTGKKETMINKEELEDLVNKVNVGFHYLHTLIHKYPGECEMQSRSDKDSWYALFPTGAITILDSEQRAVRIKPKKEFPLETWEGYNVSLIGQDQIQIGCQAFAIARLEQSLGSLLSGNRVSLPGMELTRYGILLNSAVMVIPWASLEALSAALKDYLRV